MQPAPPLPTLWRVTKVGELPPYLPQDNACRLEAGVLRAQAKVLQTLLSLPFPAFASHVLYNPQVGAFLDSYLNYARRPFELAADRHAQLEEAEPLPGMEALRMALHRLAFLVYLRLVTSEDDQQQAVAGGPASASFAALAEERQALDVARALDLCALYGFTDPALLTRLLEGAFRLLEPSLLAQLGQACVSVQEVLVELSSATAGGHHTPAAEEQDALEYLADITGGLSRLVQAVPQAARVLAAAPGLFLSLRKMYASLLAANARSEEDGPGSSSSSSDKQGRRRCFYRRFICRCILALLNAVVDGLMAHAAVHEGALEELFTLVSKLITEEEEEGEQGGGVQEAKGKGKDDDGTPNLEHQHKLLQDGIRQRNGLVVRLQKFVAASSQDKSGLDTSGVAYLIQLLQGVQGGSSLSPRKRAPEASSYSRAVDEDAMAGTTKGAAAVRDVKGMIAEVKQVCPGLGDGFVHACLAVMGYNTNMVVDSLLSGAALPYPLDTLDRSLPSPMSVDKQKRRENAGEEERDEEFIAHQKAYLRQMEQDAEDEAYLLANYDDDVDDQWEAEGFSLSRDTAREDFESIKRYNSLVKRFEEEDKYWQDMRLAQPVLAEDDEEDEEGDGEAGDGGGESKTAGAAPTPGLGGRGGGGRGRGGGGGGGGDPGPRGPGGRGAAPGGRGIGGGRGGKPAPGAPLTEAQKRFREQNKSRFANHSRKAKAARKTGGFG